MITEIKKGFLAAIVFATAFAGVALALRLASYEGVSWAWPLIAVWCGCWQLYLWRKI